jgi:hypothetical protein
VSDWTDAGAVLDDAALIASSLAELLCDCLEEESTLGAVERCVVSHGAAVEANCNSQLAVWWDGFAPFFATGDEVDSRLDVGTCRTDMVWRGTLVARLVRRCYPYAQPVGRTAIMLPTPDELLAAASGLLVDARILMCCFPESIVTAIPDGVLAQSLVQAITRVDPSAGLAGWEIRAIVQLDGWFDVGS